MGQALYRKYRSRRLRDIVGQDHVTESLGAALKQGRLSHAYLFTGPRGVGKTSIARILAHEVNNLDYHGEDNHIDIIEIDAASNRGIDEIRDLREKVYLAPASAKYKVYIIDEVHMLTTPAFNALLKTLEEPPKHVIFILATTEFHKLPETIVSRTQRYIFRPADAPKIVANLKAIARQENIQISDDALKLIADHSGGSFRDSVSLLDQAGNNSKLVDLAAAEFMLGIPPVKAVKVLVDSLAGDSLSTVSHQLDDLLSSGYRPELIARALSDELRRDLLAGSPGLGKDRQLDLLRKLIEVPTSSAPEKFLEVCLLEEVQTTPAQPPKSKSDNPNTRKSLSAPIQSPETTATPAPEVTPAEQQPPARKTTKSDKSLSTIWPELLDSLKSKHNTLYGIMRMAEPSLNGDMLTLGFRFSFHQKRMNEPKHRQLIEDTLRQLTGTVMRVECVHDQTASPHHEPIGANHPLVSDDKPQIPTNSIATISNIFGGAELLES